MRCVVYDKELCTEQEKLVWNYPTNCPMRVEWVDKRSLLLAIIIIFYQAMRKACSVGKRHHLCVYYFRLRNACTVYHCKRIAPSPPTTAAPTTTSTTTPTTITTPATSTPATSTPPTSTPPTSTPATTTPTTTTAATPPLSPPASENAQEDNDGVLGLGDTGDLGVFLTLGLLGLVCFKIARHQSKGYI